MMAIKSTPVNSRLFAPCCGRGEDICGLKDGKWDRKSQKKEQKSSRLSEVGEGVHVNQRIMDENSLYRSVGGGSCCLRSQTSDL